MTMSNSPQAYRNLGIDNVKPCDTLATNQRNVHESITYPGALLTLPFKRLCWNPPRSSGFWALAVPEFFVWHLTINTTHSFTIIQAAFEGEDSSLGLVTLSLQNPPINTCNHQSFIPIFFPEWHMRCLHVQTPKFAETQLFLEFHIPQSHFPSLPNLLNIQLLLSSLVPDLDHVASLSSLSCFMKSPEWTLRHSVHSMRPY